MTTITDVCFFNHWHNGDLFTGRRMVADIIQQLPDLQAGYAHSRHPENILDVCKTYDMESCRDVLQTFPMTVPMAVSDNILLINTWVGNYQQTCFPDNQHPSYQQQYNIYKIMYDKLNKEFGLNLTLNTDPDFYVPEIDYSFYNTQAADDFCATHPGYRYLFCNNDVQSLQSSVDNLQTVIESLAKQYPDRWFIVTNPFVTLLPNIVFTGNIFNKVSDLCEISYLSLSCEMIVGKNSGPYTYTQTLKNLSDPVKKFLCLSHDQRDTLPYGGEYKADIRFSDTTDSAQIINLIENF